MFEVTKEGALRPPKLPGVQWVRKTRKATGKTYFLLYHRKTGIPLPSDWTSSKFKKELAAAERMKPRLRLLRDLIRSYEKSPEWTRLAQSTRDVEKYMIASIKKAFGAVSLSAIQARGSRKMFLEWHAELAEERGPRAADMRLGRLQTILKFAFDREEIDRNPLKSFTRLYHTDRSMVLWTASHFAHFNNSMASDEMKLAAFVALHTGQRRGDLIAMKWQQYDGCGIVFVQSKTKRHVYIKATKALKSTLDALAELHSANGGRLIQDRHILLSATGEPYTASSFRQAWHRSVERADLPPVVVDGKEYDLHFHDIRGTTVTLLAESGATIPEIASVTGHKLESIHRILERYLGRTQALSSSAIDKLELKLLKD